MAVKRWSTAMLSAALLWATGCTGGVPEGAPAPPARERTATSVTPTPSPPRTVDPIPDALRLRLPVGDARPVEGGVEIDPMSALAAPTVDDAPVRRGMLLAQLNLFSTDDNYESIRPGHPYLMTQAGDWRQFDLPRYGFGESAYGELSTAMSPDGTKVALADPSGLVTIRLRDNSFRRFDLPVRHAVALQWSADGATLFLKDRSSAKRPCGPKGCALDVSTGALAAVPYNLFHAAPGVVGQAFEVKGSTRGHPARVITHRAGAAPRVAELAYRTSPYVAGRPAAATHVAFSQCAPARNTGDVGGVVVVRPSAGTVVALLADERGRECRLGAESWLTDHHLLVSDWLSGDLWLWDVRSEHVSRVATSRASGLNLEVAPAVLAQRLRSHLQR